MVSLVIISNSPKTAHIKQYLQATIKVTVDVVADIDQALQDIFVKRPTVVCIQNRLSDINADEIARHIQMLFRKDAPSFILMHEGDDNAKPVAGLFEHLLDLTLPETKLAKTLGAALKSILGTQWEDTCLSPPPPKGKQPQTAGITLNRPREYSAVEEHDAFVLVNSLDEFMTTMPEAQVRGLENGVHPDQEPAAASPATKPLDTAPRKNTPSRQLPVEHEKTAKQMGHETSFPEETVIPSRTIAPSPPLSVRPTSPPLPAAPPPPVAKAVPQDHRPVSKPAVSPPSITTPPGDFRITAAATAAAGREQSDIAPFIESFELPDRRWRRRVGIALAMATCAVAWYLLRQKPGAATKLQKPAPVAVAIQKTASSVHHPIGNTDAPLPAFIPADGRDNVYTARHPGWERYAGADYECRIFRENNRIKAVQVLPAKRQSLDEEFLKKVLTELVGNDHFRVTSRENVQDYLIERGSVADKADLMLYIRKSKLHAFVVSLI
ncbi:hypothetical protein [Geobacter sp. AOG2]|uniref:hypothetical protein n=1 Tax=Geobacter sp. AOG2 TaxID=1566347 RepID=UPI001CC41A7E|nr:hypothetical protein [Geobacter sp. AOG2]GFE61471.1 hypothetical protein AOG2_20580 [Geobacter sp. AOG2]